MLMAPGSLVTADSGRIPLKTGAYVRLAGNSQGTRAALHPPLLRVVVPDGSVKRGSAGAGFDSVGGRTLSYTLTPRASSAWCSFTRFHLNLYAAIVLDNHVISDPSIQSAICGGQTEITALASSAQARMIAAYLNFGSLPFMVFRA
jgi:preprotein translocase subunit SecD